MLPADDFSHLLFHSHFFEVPTSGHYPVLPGLMALTKKKISLEFYLGGNYIYSRKKSWEPDGNQCSFKRSSTFCPGSLDT